MDAMTVAFKVLEQPDGVTVTTHCVYPSNTFVKVIVRGGARTFYVSDDGGALREIEAAGAEIAKPDKLLARIVTKYGLSISGGIIRSPQVEADALGPAVALVANASRDAADWLFDHARIKHHRDFKVLLRQFLEKRFVDRVHNEVVVGQSNKPHKFDYMIHLAGGRRIIVDPVVRDTNAINARVVANMDVRAARHENLEQRIVYDDEDDWSAEDLNLLQVGAPVVAFSKAPEVFGRLNGR